MELNHYQTKSREFAVYPGKGKSLTYVTFGICGEAGEFANQVKKILRDDKGEISEARFDKLADELGDVLWYVANAASELGTTLEHVANYNLHKLSQRRQYDSIHGDRRA